MKTVLDLPSLKHISLAKTSVFLWKYNFIIQIKKNTTDSHKKQWLDIQEAVCKLVVAFDIPKELKPLLSSLVRHVGKQLWDLLKFLFTQVFNGLNFLEPKFVKSIIQCTQWTAHGQLDMTKTARVLSELREWTIKSRFDIGIVCCVADVVEDIWNESANIVRRSFDKQKETNLKNIMYKYWKRLTIKTDASKITFNKKIEMFFLSINYKNQCAVEYFWSLMRQCERNALIKLLVRRESKLEDLIEHVNKDFKCNDCFCTFEIGITSFLLAEMDEQQMRAVLSSDYGLKPVTPLLIHFFDVDSFTPTSSRIINLIASGDDFYDIICKTVVYPWYQYGDFSRVKECLTRFWINAPAEMKKCHYDHKYSFIYDTLCKAQDFDNLHVLLHDADIKKRSRILSRCVAQLFIKNSQLYFNWDFLELIAKIYITTKEEMTTFKMHCSYLAFHIGRTLLFDISDKNKWAKLDRYLRFAFSDANEMRNLKKTILIDYFTYIREGSRFIDRFLNWLPETAAKEMSDVVATDLQESLSVLSFYFHKDLENIALFNEENVQQRKQIVSISFYKISEIINTHEAGKLDRDFLKLITRRNIQLDNEMVFKEFCCCLAYKVFAGCSLCRYQSMVEKFLNSSFVNSHDASYCIRSITFYYLIQGGAVTHPDMSNQLKMMLGSCGYSQDEIRDRMETYVD